MGEETEVFQNEQLPFSRWLYPLTMVLGLISMILNACGTDQKSLALRGYNCLPQHRIPSMLLPQ